jgi:hypothetical protein
VTGKDIRNEMLRLYWINAFLNIFSQTARRIALRARCSIVKKLFKMINKNNLLFKHEAVSTDDEEYVKLSKHCVRFRLNPIYTE